MTSDMRDLIFKPTVISSGSDNTSGKISQRQIRITIRTGTMHVESISIVPRTFASYLDTTLNPGVPYVPQYPGSPATKKYVDDNVPTKVSDLTNDSNFQTDTQVNQAISTAVSSAYKYKGSVASYSNLPSTGLTSGDVYNVTDTGMNYAWTGSAWDALGATVDMSNYIAKNNTAAFTPSGDYNPSTKKYVDDTVASAKSTGATAPSSPVEGQLWYDTTNDVLKVYDGTNWNAVDTNTTYNAGEGIEIGTIQDYSAMRGPCPEGFHVPTKTEMQSLIDTGVSLSAWSTGNTNMSIYLKLPPTGYRSGSSSSGAVVSTTTGYYQTCTKATSSNNYYLTFYSTTSIEHSGKNSAYAIRPFKDSPVVPDSNWTTIYSGTGDAGIFHNAILGLISISSDGINWITIADKNLGATVVWNNGDATSQSNKGGFYQRGNNYMFPATGSITTSSTKVDASDYGPGNYYSSSTFIYGGGDWSSVTNNNLWGGVTGVVAIDNAISNTGVLSVNGQTGDVTINAGEASSIATTQPSNPVEGDVYYDTTNDQLKVYDGTNWNVVGDDAADINTKTFYLSSTSDTTTAQAIYDWYNNGKNPIVAYGIGNSTFILYDTNGFQPSEPLQTLLFRSSYITEYNNQSAGYSQIALEFLRIKYNSNIDQYTITLEQIPMDNKNSYLGTNKNYTTPYTPAYPGSPATKKYVDDSVSGAVSKGSTAPSSPVEGQLWYDTTNDVLKSYNGTAWVEVGGGITNNTTGTTSTISQEWVGTKAEFEALSSYGNIIYNIIE